MPRQVAWLVLVLVGCGPKVEKLRALARTDAVAHTDYLRLLSLDDDVIFEYPERVAMHAQRTQDFEALIATKLAAIGPLGPATAADRFGTLLALRTEARRDPGQPTDI
jgi:hypothetical protein